MEKQKPIVWMIQGQDMPEEAQRPSDEQLAIVAGMTDLNWQISYAYNLAAQGYTLDAQIDVYGANYHKTMQQRREYGQPWVPAVGMANIVAAPAPGEEYPPAPVGAILVPPTIAGWPDAA